MKVQIFPSPLGGVIPGISAKSCLHRLLIAAALSKGETVIGHHGLSNDVKATISAIAAFGKGAETDGRLLRVFDAPPTDTMNVGESGSTFRFVLPLAAALAGEREIVIDGSAYLAARPISPLYEELVAHGACLSEKGRFPMTVKGGLSGGIYDIPGNISSQYVTGLLLTLPLCRKDSEIRIQGDLQSRPYVDITLECLKIFGIVIREKDNVFYVPGYQRYVSPGNLVCENDWSNAAFFLAAGALSEQPVGVSGLRADSPQGDRAVASVLAGYGAEPDRGEDFLAFRRGALHGQTFDATDVPDLVPVLALVAAVSQGTTEIVGASRLRFKESDRLHSVTVTLTALGAKIAEREDGLRIEGVPKLTGGTVHSFNDHRIAMTAAIAATVSENPVIIEDFQAVNKSYPDFLQDFALLGGKYQILED